MIEREVSRLILREALEELQEATEVDVAIAGAGPAGLTAAAYLAERGLKVLVLERNLSVGGGMWGGGMLFPRVVVGKNARGVVEYFGARFKVEGGALVLNPMEMILRIALKAFDNGAKVMVGIDVEDVIAKEGRVCGFVINFSAVKEAGFHVDPLMVEAKACVDATGHDATVCRVVERKVGMLNTPSGSLMGEKSLHTEAGENFVVEHTGEVFPGLYVAGMAVCAVYGGPRMGPVFGGMLLSGKRVADIILRSLKGTTPRPPPRN